MAAGFLPHKLGVIAYAGQLVALIMDSKISNVGSFFYLHYIIS